MRGLFRELSSRGHEEVELRSIIIYALNRFLHNIWTSRVSLPKGWPPRNQECFHLALRVSALRKRIYVCSTNLLVSVDELLPLLLNIRLILFYDQSICCKSH